MNILGNANKFTENGQIDLVLSTESLGDNKITPDHNSSRYRVGISESDLGKIF